MWLELSLTIRESEQERVELALEEAGALAVTLLDAEADTPNERAILEPGVGETPLWGEISLQALFEADTDREGLLHVLAELLPEIEPSQVRFREVADQDWTRAWMDQFKPMRFGRRLWIYPSNVEPPGDDADAVVVRLDPGLAFGTGTHPTTALCLEWLDGLDLAGTHVIDYGCGSGVLAIAAIKLGAEHVDGIDNDPQAILASRDNAERNGVADRLSLYLPDEFVVRACDVFVANILAGPLGELAPHFAGCIKPGAPFALSGILVGQADELLARYAEWFDDLTVATREDWVRISGRRRM
ncbi:50S ribosomal protein L11 methyltransferase [Dokdonella fugitiva]|jgi:ribosomal protein L11 methyltransferase|uniref:Ribosomal protein L11 methyltransferase n=1 Tax=Dokdonella fugitiva TaxID=328517 RepID=A0A4R2I175_9GAMM|nr:50S ribosomal protein L11 methyltransferase [Dokdonella fugitiva]MBA8883742.1 ribosomal protein L11 methyltransferase [Dokdonella fugitiva]TCO36125.1 ribosomal protein L11 methyltransferase [Dokdonella fugitiva]